MYHPGVNIVIEGEEGLREMEKVAQGHALVSENMKCAMNPGV